MNSSVPYLPVLNYPGQSDTNVSIVFGHFLNILRNDLIYGSLLMFFLVFFFDYDSISFFGIRQILNFLKTKELKPLNEIKKSRMLGIIRHPMYLALINCLWWQTFKMAEIVVNTVLMIYIIIGTILEKKKLVLEFGETYIQYQKKVPMLIPFKK
jgi:methanethiol S-methyltransferase